MTDRSHTDHSDTVAGNNWSKLCRSLDEVGKAIHRRAEGHRSAEELEQVNESLLGALTVFSAIVPQYDRDHPDWFPFQNSLLRRFNACPDTTYTMSYIWSSGCYRLSGHRGTVLMVHAQIYEGDPGLPHRPALLADINIDDYTIDQDGRFEILLGPKRPEGYSGDWIEIQSAQEEAFVFLRQISYDWKSEVDADISIQRVDREINKSLTDQEELARRMEILPDRIAGVVSFMQDIMESQHGNAGAVNSVQDVSKTMPILTEQAYTHGILTIGPDDAWIAECQIPDSVRYWSVQLMDYFYNALDFTYRQSGLNGHQSVVDPDGILRIVVCHDDPGVPNWLDCSDYKRLQIRFRWFGSEHPDIKTRLVPRADLIANLPKDLATISPEERQAALRARVEGAQKRRR